jgi:hypothetical protein
MKAQLIVFNVTALAAIVGFFLIMKFKEPSGA